MISQTLKNNQQCLAEPIYLAKRPQISCNSPFKWSCIKQKGPGQWRQDIRRFYARLQNWSPLCIHTAERHRVMHTNYTNRSYTPYILAALDILRCTVFYKRLHYIVLKVHKHEIFPSVFLSLKTSLGPLIHNPKWF